MDATLAALLTEVLEELDAQVANRDGQDPFGVQECSKCDASAGDHSLGCRIRAALSKAAA